MTSSWRKILLAVCASAISLIPQIALASGKATATCTYDKNVVYFFNGIRSDYQGAIANREHINAELSKFWLPGAIANTEFRQFFNDSAIIGTGNFLKEVLDLGELIEGLNESEQFEKLAALYFGTSAEAPSPELVAQFESYMAEILDDILERHSSLDSTEIAQRSGFADEIERVKRDLEDGKNVALVGYSQGSVFANLFYKIVSRSLTDAEKDRFSVIAVGSPDSSVPGGNYANYFEDGVLRAFRETYGKRRKYLEPNLNSSRECEKFGVSLDPICNRFAWHHMFAESYLLDGSEGWEKAVLFLVTALTSSAPEEGFTPTRETPGGRELIEAEDVVIAVYATGLDTREKKRVLHLVPRQTEAELPSFLEAFRTAGRFSTITDTTGEIEAFKGAPSDWEARYLSCYALKSVSKFASGSHRFRVDLDWPEDIRIVIALPRLGDGCPDPAGVPQGWEIKCSPDRAPNYFLTKNFYQQSHQGAFSSIQLPVNINETNGKLTISFDGKYTWFVKDGFPQRRLRTNP